MGVKPKSRGKSIIADKKKILIELLSRLDTEEEMIREL